MAPAAWTGESSSSIAFSMNPRDSRVVSIYDKYLYDPKDLESSDPRRRELARKASQLKLHGRPANNMDANGLRSAVGQPNPLPPSQQRKSVAFSNPAKVDPAQSNRRPNDAGAFADHRDSTHDRDSGAFGLGLGMLGGSDTESDSDSDDGRPARNKSNPDNMRRSKDSDRPDSWTDRAVAVGHRPPDHASQNPPSLKLMALKSSRQGSDVSGASQDGRSSSLAVDNHNLVDRTSRHGSTIGFAGPPLHNQAASRPAEPDSASKRLSARTALTKQLGLVTPNPEPAGASPSRGPSPDQRGAPHDYFDNRAPNATQARSPPRNAAGLPPIDVARAQQHGFNAAHPNARGMPSPMGSQHGSVSTPNSATPLRSPGYAAMPSPNRPYGQGPVPPNVLQRGPPSPYGQRGPPQSPYGPGGPGGPNPPSSLPAGPGARPPPTNMQRGPGPQHQNAPGGRGPSGPGGSFGPSFSDTAGPSKRQSIFRRSMAMLGGGPQSGPPSSGPGSNHAQRPQPGQKRQSLFRRSMAMLTGNGGAPHPPPNAPPHQNGQQMRMPAPVVPRAPSAPRVQGLQNDFEKPDHPRKSQFLGAGGEGAEWDADGEGAKFWRRFSMAQKGAGTHKLEDGSRAWMASMASGRRKLIVMGVIALVALVGIIVGVIVWREIVAPSGSNSDEPKSIYKANLGDQGNSGASPSGNNAATTTSKKAKATATSSTSSSSSWGSRSLPVDAIVDDVIKRHQRRAVTHELGSQKMRKRHFGRAVAPASSQQQRTSLTELD